MLLQVQDLAVHYSADGVEIPALQGISFNIGAGEVVGLLGESGCGKTTTALSLLGVLPPAGRVSAGSIRFRERELVGLDERELREIRGAGISIIPQDPSLSLNPVMRVGDQIAEVIRAHTKSGTPERRQKAESMLQQVRLSEGARIYSSYPHQLSGGQLQRVAIAQAISCTPALLIADEPTAALDTIVQSEILTLMMDLKKRFQMALLWISHNPAVLARVADRVFVMYAGSIVEHGTVEEILNPLHPYTRALLKSTPRPAGSAPPDKFMPSIAGSAPDMARLPEGCPFESRCADRIEVCSVSRPHEVRCGPTRHVRCFKYAE